MNPSGRHIVIFAAPRSGSTLLATLAANKTGRKCLWEYFHPKHRRLADSRGSNTSQRMPLRKWLLARLAALDSVEQAVLKVFPHHVDAIWPEFTQWAQKRALVIVLYRRNPRAQILSYGIAQATGVWNDVLNKERSASGPQQVSHKALETAARHLEQFYARWEQLQSDRIISYEDLCASTNLCLTNLFGQETSDVEVYKIPAQLEPKWNAVRNVDLVRVWLRDLATILEKTISLPTPATYVRLTHENPDHTRHVLVDWTLGNYCNYSCSYCPPSLHSGSQKFPTVQSIVEFARRVVSHFRALNKRCLFQFTGGEVTLHRDFKDIVRKIVALDAEVSLLSNGSMPLRWWEDIAHLLDAVLLTYHIEHANLDRFLKLATLLMSKTRVHVNVTMIPERFAECRGVITRLQEAHCNLSVTAKPLLVDFGDIMYPYSENQRKFLTEQQMPFKQRVRSSRGLMVRESTDGERRAVKPAHLIASFENRWTGWRCSIGTESLVIKLDGSIYRGHCRVGGLIGKIDSGHFSLPTSPVTCTRDRCSCAADILTTKVRPGLRSHSNMEIDKRE